MSTAESQPVPPPAPSAPTLHASPTERLRLPSVAVSVSDQARLIALIVGIGFILRLLIGLTIPPARVMVDDTGWYIRAGAVILRNAVTPETVVGFPPLYALLTGGATLILGPDAAIPALRLLQMALGALLAAPVFRITYRLAHNRRAAVVAALGIALNPILIIDCNLLASETLFLFLFTWALSIYVTPEAGAPRKMLATGALLGLATLTRAALVAFPLGLAIHLLLTLGWRNGLRAAFVLLIAYVGVVGSWSLWNAVKLNRLQFGGYGINDMLLAGAVGYEGTASVDQAYKNLTGGEVPIGAERDAAALKAVGQTLFGDPVGYFSRRLGELAGALLQPHQTPFFVGPSLRDLLLTWWRADRSLVSALAVVRDPTFVPKLLLYVAHWSALALAVVGLWRSRRLWLAFAPVTGLIAYFLLIHLFLLALPRYLFPITPALWVLAGVAVAGLGRGARKSARGD